MIFTVAHLELLKAARRGAHHRLRHLYVGVLAVELLFFGVLYFVRAHVGETQDPRVRDASLIDLASLWLDILLVQHFVLVAAVAPALAGGAVTEEKTRGTLGLLLTTQLRSREILPGKAIGAVAQIGCLALPVAPALVWLTYLSGRHELAILCWLAESLVLASLLVSLSLLASVMAPTTARAMAMTYVSLGAVLIAIGVLGGSELPFATLAWRHAGQAESAEWLLLGIGLAAAAGILVVATGRLRSAHERHLMRAVVSSYRRDRAPVGTQPLRWKERYGGQAFFALLQRMPLKVRIGLLCLTPPGIGLLMGFREEYVLVICVMLLLGPGLAIGLRSAAAISLEKEQSTWDTLLTTQLDGRQIVRGKLWGLIDGAMPYMLPWLVASLATVAMTQLRFVAAVLASWILGWGFLYFQAANGIHWSAKSESSWQALLRTQADAVWAFVWRSLALGIAGAAFAVVFFTFCGLFALASPTGMALLVLLGYAVPVMVTLFAEAEKLLQDTEKSVHPGASHQGADLRRVFVKGP